MKLRCIKWKKMLCQKRFYPKFMCQKSRICTTVECRIIKRRSQTKWKWLNVHIKPLLPKDSCFDHFSKVPKLGLFTFTQLSKGYYIRLMWNDEREDPNLVSDIFEKSKESTCYLQKYQRILFDWVPPHRVSNVYI